ncbi:cation:proton antiporter [Amycolatopsis sp. cmx-4-68]|uniref:cation:proton antiporter n=1 Tax=Amycolatopsis sp. cmx-4-68 TaxID=2790938 RepID=UPI0039783578
MSNTDLFRVLTALALLLLAARLAGQAFLKLRLPPVIGEILGGLLLGPTLFGAVAPGPQQWLFPKDGPPAAGLGLVYQLGMLLLMFLAGMEMRVVFSRDERRTVAWVAVVGMAVPFVFAVVALRWVDTSRIIGPLGSTAALTLVVGIGMAVTSIPVISRIMLDLGIIRTRFAGIVLSVAVAEDVVLNVLLAVALGMSDEHQGRTFGLQHLFGIETVTGSAIYSAVAAIAFFAVAALVAAVLTKRRAATPETSRGARPVAVHMLVFLGLVVLCLFLGITPIFGTFVLGLMMSGEVQRAQSGSSRVIAGFASGFFIPVYFAVVGLRLDLLGALDLWFTVPFIAVACVVKATSVYAGARMVGTPPVGSANLAVAMNARGGPGIVLATVAHDNGIVNDEMFTTLVLTAVVTSLMAGAWLRAASDRGLLE